MSETYPNNNRELSTSKPVGTKPSLFARSMTIHAANSRFANRNVSSVDRNVSSKKWFESAGTSFKGKVKQLRTLFETPHPKQHQQHAKNYALNDDDDHDDDEKKPYHPPQRSGSHLHNHSSFARLRPVKSISTDFKDSWSILDASSLRLPGTEDRVVIYFTSLRGVRRTFDDCYSVRLIFRGFNVFVDERDVSMDNAYRKELESLLKDEKNVSLPRVFIKGRYVGGVDLIRQLNETGDLKKIVNVLPVKDRRLVCECCGDYRFLLCSNCNGSRKLFDEEEGIVKRCLVCNENGLIRCPQCCL